MAIKEKIESDADNWISDLHIWRVGPSHFAVIISLVSHTPKTPDYYKGLLTDFHKLSHITVEVINVLEMAAQARSSGHSAMRKN